MLRQDYVRDTLQEWLTGSRQIDVQFDSPVTCAAAAAICRPGTTP